MAASIEIAKQSKQAKKLKKKQQKISDTLEKQEGIKICDLPTRVLCVHNGGLDNGIGREDISAIFNKDGLVVDIIMLQRKPYCFLCYNDVKDASRAVEELNGFEILPGEKRKHAVKLYLSFVNKVPKSIAPSNDRPPGLILIENFVSEDEESALISSVQWKNESGMKHREVKHYGYEFRYDINDVDADDPLPEHIPNSCQDLLKRALETGHVKHYPDQLTINKYLPGQGIPPHVDTQAAFEDGIMSLSLMSQVVMDFTHPNGQHLSVLLPRRSLLIMTGEARYVWSHGITPRKSDIVTSMSGLDLVMRDTRMSFTFRKIIPPSERVKRKIPFQESNVNVLLPQTHMDAYKLENSHVQQVYEEIADHFSGTRHTPWPRISDFIKKMPTGSLMADIGCGNGKYLGINPSIFEIGSDRSFNLSQICRDRSHEVYVGDVLNIPIRSETLDFCICIAVIHHMSTLERRVMAVKELLRILTPGGKLLIYVWAMEQELHKIKSKYLKESKLGEIQNKQNHDSDTTTGEQGNSHTLAEAKNNSAIGNTCLQSESSNVFSDEKECKTNDKNEDFRGDNLQSEKDLSESLNFNGTEMSGNHGEEGKNKSVNSLNCCLSVHKNRTHFQQQDVLVPWERKGADNEKKCFHRYYHVFKEGELEEMCNSIKECQIIDRYYDQGNWAVILKKHLS